MRLDNWKRELAKKLCLSAIRDGFGRWNGDDLTLAKGLLTIIACLGLNAVHRTLKIQGDLDVAIKKADASIAAKAAESEKAIAEIRAGAMEAVAEVARDAAAEIVAVMGGKADADAIATAVDQRMKG